MKYKLLEIQSQCICELVENRKLTGNQLHLLTCPAKFTWGDVKSDMHTQ